MRLTKKKAIEITKELWDWLAETGSPFKGDWPEWNEYGEMTYDCPLCEYGWQQRGSLARCYACPYYNVFGHCVHALNPFRLWADAETHGTRKKYAAQFRAQLEQL